MYAYNNFAMCVHAMYYIVCIMWTYCMCYVCDLLTLYVQYNYVFEFLKFHKQSTQPTVMLIFIIMSI